MLTTIIPTLYGRHFLNGHFHLVFNENDFSVPLERHTLLKFHWHHKCHYEKSEHVIVIITWNWNADTDNFGTKSYHYDAVIMTTISSQITSLTVVYSTVYSDADQRKHQSSASLAFVWGIHRDRWIPRTKGQLRGKCFHLMTSSCHVTSVASNAADPFIFDMSILSPWSSQTQLKEKIWFLL